MKLKKFVALFISAILVFALSIPAFAADDSSKHPPIPENAVKHTISVSVPANDVADVWGNPSCDMADHVTYYTDPFYVSDPYFGYEMTAYGLDGDASNQFYTINLQLSGNNNGGIFMAGMTGRAHGGRYKLDWISLNASTNYRFQVINNTDYILCVDIIYYSWN